VNERAGSDETPAGVRAIADLLRRSLEARIAGVSLLLVTVFGLLGAALWTFGEVADEMAEGETQALDERVLALLRQRESPALDAAAYAASWAGAELVALLLVALLVWLGWRRRLATAAQLLLVTGGAQLLNNVLKDHFQRTRPAPVPALIPAQEWGFPSGHAMVAAAFYAFLALYAVEVLHGWWRGAAVTTLVAIVLCVGLSRMYLGVHYLTDVVAGYAAGLAWTTAVVLAGRLLPARVRIRGITTAL
jgi:undecaprenyl-diphosphatase